MAKQNWRDKLQATLTNEGLLCLKISRKKLFESLTGALLPPRAKFAKMSWTRKSAKQNAKHNWKRRAIR